MAEVKATNCRFCHRALRSPVSIRQGAGPYCAARFRSTLTREKLERDGQLRLFRTRSRVIKIRGLGINQVSVSGWDEPKKAEPCAEQLPLEFAQPITLTLPEPVIDEEATEELSEISMDHLRKQVASG